MSEALRGADPHSMGTCNLRACKRRRRADNLDARLAKAGLEYTVHLAFKINKPSFFFYTGTITIRNFGRFFVVSFSREAGSLGDELPESEAFLAEPARNKVCFVIFI